MRRSIRLQLLWPTLALMIGTLVSSSIASAWWVRRRIAEREAA